MPPTEQTTLIDDRYEIVSRLDAGGMGVVYRAVDRRLGRPVAVKVVRTTDPRLAERSAREARLLARVDHLNVVRVYDAGIHDGQPYIVTELVSGRPLSQVIARGALTPQQVGAIGASAAAGLAATHRVGVVHRDLKPANILVSDRGVVRLLDYGVASSADIDRLTLDGEVVGTPRYLAPEQVSGEEVGPPADVYALGLVLLECLTGHHPFGGTAIESMTARLTRDPEVPGSLAEPLPSVLSTMTARDPADRPSASAVADRLAVIGVDADLHALGAPDDATTIGAVPYAAPSGASNDPTVALHLGDASTESPAPAPTMVLAPSVPGSTSRHRRGWWVAFLLAAAVLIAGSAVGARVLADRTSDGGTVPTTSTTEPPTTTTTTTHAPTTTIRPTTTTAPPTTTTTTTTKKGRGKPGNGGKPGG